MTNVQVAESRQLARPLKVLTPLIQSDFEQAEKAGMPYYRAAGEKLVEAREGHFKNDTSGFYTWAEKTFEKKREQIRAYVATVTIDPHKSFTSLDKVKHAAGMRPERIHTGYVRREWTAPVDAIAEKARREAQRLAIEEQMTRRQEREAEAKLGQRLIDIGYKVLAQELHPDKVGGSREAMTRLNRVRDRLKANV